MTLDAISARSINFKMFRDPRMEANDLMIAVSIMNFRMTEMLITMQLEKFKEGVDKIAELSAIKNKYTSQMAQMSDEQKKAGLYIDADGNLVSVKDSGISSEIQPPDPDILAAAPVNESWSTKLTTADGEVLDIKIDYEMGYENGQYYFQMTGFHTGDYNTSTDTTVWKTESSYTLSPDKFQKQTCDGTQSLNSILQSELQKVIDSIQVENQGHDINDIENRSGLWKDLSNDYNAQIIAGLQADVYATMQAKGYDNKSFDAIFTRAGGESGLSDIKNISGSMIVDVEVFNIKFELTITWKMNPENGNLIFDAYLRSPDASKDNLVEAAGGTKANGSELLHIVKGYEAKPTDGEDETAFFERVFKDIAGRASETINSHATDAIGFNNQHTAFWEALLGKRVEFKKEDHWDQKAQVIADPYHMDDDMKKFFGDHEVVQHGHLHRKSLRTLSDAHFAEAAQHIGDAIFDAIGSESATAPGEFAKEIDYSLLTLPDSAVATDGTSAVIRGVYEPNLTQSVTYGGNRQAFLEEILGPDIYTNGFAYTSDYWDTQIIPQITDAITALGTNNEVVMSKLKRLIETANSYLQMIITDLQKQFQSLNAVANNM